MALARKCHGHDRPLELEATHRKILGVKYEEVQARSKILRAPWRTWELLELRGELIGLYLEEGI